MYVYGLLHVKRLLSILLTLALSRTPGSIVCDVHSTNQSVFNKVHPQQVSHTHCAFHSICVGKSILDMCKTI